MKPQLSQETQDSEVRFIGPRENERLTALSRWTIWRKEAEGTFPRSIRLGGKRVWIESEVRQWMADRIAERG
jgi:prophage regulatory protein